MQAAWSHANAAKTGGLGKCAESLECHTYSKHLSERTSIDTVLIDQKLTSQPIRLIREPATRPFFLAQHLSKLERRNRVVYSTEISFEPNADAKLMRGEYSAGGKLQTRLKDGNAWELNPLASGICATLILTPERILYVEQSACVCKTLLSLET